LARAGGGHRRCRREEKTSQGPQRSDCFVDSLIGKREKKEKAKKRGKRERSQGQNASHGAGVNAKGIVYRRRESPELEGSRR